MKFNSLLIFPRYKNVLEKIEFWYKWVHHPFSRIKRPKLVKYKHCHLLPCNPKYNSPNIRFQSGFSQLVSRSDSYEMLFLGIITIQIIQTMVVSGGWPLLNVILCNERSTIQVTYGDSRSPTQPGMKPIIHDCQ